MAELPVMPVKVQPASPKSSGPAAASKSEASDSNEESSSFSKVLNKRMDGSEQNREVKPQEKTAEPRQATAKAGESSDLRTGKELPQEAATTDDQAGQALEEEILTETLLTEDASEAGKAAEQTEVSPLALTQMLLDTQSGKAGGDQAAIAHMTPAAEQARQLQAQALNAAATRSDSAQPSSPVAQAVHDALNDGDLPADALKQFLGKAAEKSELSQAAVHAALQNRTAVQVLPERMMASDTMVNHTGQGISQAAQFTPATAQPGLPSTQIPLPMQHPQWGDALSEKVMWVSNQKLQGAEIKLNPPQLGPIEVRVKMSNEQGQSQAQVSFTAHHALTRDALENALPRLREMFNANGVDLIDVNVSDRSFADQDRDTARAQQKQFAAGLQDGVEEEMGLEGLSAKITQLPSGAIDLFA